MIIDSHAHVSDRWYEPVDTLLMQMDRQGIDAAVLVQLLGHYQNDYLIECCRRYADRFSAVVLVDPNSEDALQELEHWKGMGARGVRLRPTARSPGSDPLAVWRKACELDLVISCVGSSAAFLSSEFLSVLDALPELSVMIEHLGGTSTAAQDDEGQQLHKRVLALARYPNVYMKVPGLGELMQRKDLDTLDSSPKALPMLLTEAIDAFGPSRLMWGSDFPVVCSREGYQRAKEWVAESLRSCVPEAGLADIMGGTVRKLMFS